MKHVACVVVAAAMLAACDSKVQIAGPYYLMSPELPEDTALFYCMDDIGCAGDGLPGPTVFAAGSNANFIVLARHPRTGPVTDRQTDWKTTEYFYIRRAEGDPEPNASWDGDAKAITGPLTAAQFEAASEELGLPDFSTVRRQLESSNQF